MDIGAYKKHRSDLRHGGVDQRRRRRITTKKEETRPVSTDSYLEGVTKLMMLDRMAWSERLQENVFQGKQIEYKPAIADAEQMLEGAVIPKHVVFDLDRFFGFESTFQNTRGQKYHDTAKPFDISLLTEVLACSEHEAADILSFFILLSKKHEIQTLLEYYDTDEEGWAFLRERHVDIERLKDVFRNEEFYNGVTDMAFERALPVLGKNMEAKGFFQLLNSLDIYKVYEMAPTDPLWEYRKKSLEARFSEHKVSFLKDLSMYPIEEGLNKLPYYEMVFGELSKEDFLQYFPLWYKASSWVYRHYQERYGLELPSKEPDGGPLPFDRDRKDTTAPQQDEGRAPVIVEDAPNRKGLSGRQTQYIILSLVAALGALGVTASFKNENEPGQQSLLKENDEKKEKSYTSIPSLSQEQSIRVNNLSPESLEYKKAQEEKDFVSVPSFEGMLATDVYTNIGENGDVSYKNEFVFHPEDHEITDKNSERYTIAQRVFAQGVVLYPPELGRVDVESIFIDGYSSDEYSVEKGELGRYRITLKTPPKEGFKVVYDILAVKSFEKIPYEGKMPSVPDVTVADLQNLNKQWGVDTQEHKDTYALALGLERIIRDQYVYPKTQEEKQLSYREARKQRIGDCDVSNLELLALLQENGIPAMLVGDLHPVPGREAHGQIRAVVFSESLGKSFIIKLNATPWRVTSEGQKEMVRKSIGLSGEKHSEHTEGNLGTQIGEMSKEKRELLDLIERRQTLRRAYEKAKSASGDEVVYPHTSVQRDWNGGNHVDMHLFRQGIWGYSEFMLLTSGLMPQSFVEQKRVVANLTRDITLFLQEKGVILQEEDPEDWSRKIDKHRAEQMKFFIDTEFPIERIHRVLD